MDCWVFLYAVKFAIFSWNDFTLHLKWLIPGPPEFLLDNMQVKYGAIGNLVSFWIQIYSNNELLSSTIQRYDGQNNVTSNTEQTKVLGYIIAHGVRVMVLWTKLHFEIHIQNTDDFTNYTIIVCNTRGCSNMTLELRAASKYCKAVKLIWQRLHKVFYIFKPIEERYII